MAPGKGWGYVDGSDLEACGLNVDDPSLEYAANVWLLGDKPIKALLYPAALDHYKVFYYEKDETSIFGEGLVRVMRHSALSIAAASRMVLDNGACVAGNTEVYRNRSTAYGTDLPDSRPAVITIKELWDTKYKHNSGLRRMKIRSINEDTGEIFYNRIVDVFNNGVRPVFEMKTLKGYHVKSTDDHRFMRDDGDWQEARDFCIRDMIAVNGKHNRPSGICINCGKTTKGTGIRCRSCAMIKTHPPDIDLPKKCIECGAKTATRGVRCKKCAAKLENNSWNRRQAEEASLNMDASANTSRQRWACQKDKKDVCERCGAKSDAGIRLDVHHKDRNPYNNDPSNKLTLCCPCHMWIQSRHDYFGQPFQHKYVDYDEIVSIEYVGEEEVFDIQVETPNHNFIANGFVAHNCVAGPQVEVNWSLMTPGTDLNSFYSRKIWFREGKGVDAQYPALRVYNIDSHIGELMKIIELFKSFGDEETTLPTWMIGQQVNNETAQATSGRNSTVLVSIKDIVKNFDAFTEHIIRDMYAWNMEFNPRQDIKGDYLCKARGVSSLVMKEIRMQALVQLNSTLTPEQRDYIPEGEMVNEIFKAHDINITLLSDEEVQKKREAREQSIQNQLALKMAEAEISYKKAQTMSQLTKAKKTNTDATIAANTPIEQPAGSDPRLADAELQGKQTETVGKEAEIRRQDEQHALDLQHQDEQHRVKIATEAAKTSQDMEIKGKTADHSMAMSEKMTQAKAKQAGKAPKPKKPAKGV